MCSVNELEPAVDGCLLYMQCFLIEEDTLNFYFLEENMHFEWKSIISFYLFFFFASICWLDRFDHHIVCGLLSVDKYIYYLINL